MTSEPTKNAALSSDGDGWVPTYEKATSLHIGPSEVLINGDRYYSEGRVVAALVRAYTSGAPVAVAYACDEILDTSGRLLGLVRDAARV